MHDNVVSAMTRQLQFGAANIGGHYRSSERCLSITASARKAAADLFRADPTEITFGNNMTTLTFHLAHAIAADTFEQGDNVVLSSLDHDANVGPWVRLAKDYGVEVRWIPVKTPDCNLDMNALDALVDSRTKLIAGGFASNAVGSVNDVSKMCSVAREIGALSFVDAVHYAPHAILDVIEVGCDFMACSPYKFFGPHSGLLYGRKDIMKRLRAFKIRPSSDELPSAANFELSRWELGTQNFEALAGVEACIDYVGSIGERFGGSSGASTRRERLVSAWSLVEEHERDLKIQFLRGATSVPGLCVYGIDDIDRIDERTATFAVSVDGFEPDHLVTKLCERGIFCTSGNHYCTFWEKSLGLSNDDGAARLGFLHYNTIEEVDRALEALESVSNI